MFAVSKYRILIWIQISFIIFIIHTGPSNTTSCNARKYSHSSVVCVCNSTYCDNEEIEFNIHGNNTDIYFHYVSTEAGARLKRLKPTGFTHKEINVSPYNNSIAEFHVDTEIRFQEIYGFGGAITDSVCINLKKLSQKTQIMLMRQYFGKDGIDYTFIRLPIGGTDFSLKKYTYDDVENDTTLSHFQLREEDDYKIYYTKLARNISRQPIKLVTASWSSPEWMKELRVNVRGHTRLQKKYYQLYADYIIKFLDEYKKRGIEFWGISPQNEPHDGVLIYFGFNSLGFTGDELKIWLRDYFGPTIKQNYSNIKILLLDDERGSLATTGMTLMSDETIAKMVSGIALHGYRDQTNLSPTFLLDDAHSTFPDKFLMYTEASIMHAPNDPAVLLGDWSRAEYYAHCIIEDLSHYVSAFIDWNIALNFEGGPTWAGNTLDSTIIVNDTADEFYKQPMFYAIAHISKFVPPGSVHIRMKTISDDDRGIENVAFLRPDNYTVLVLMNKDNIDKSAVIRDRRKGITVINLPAHSIHTLIYMSNNKDESADHNHYHSGSNKNCEVLVPLLIVFLTLYFCS